MQKWRVLAKNEKYTNVITQLICTIHTVATYNITYVAQ